MEILNNVGVCTSRKTAYRTADDLNENNAFKLSMWKWVCLSCNNFRLRIMFYLIYFILLG